jgi:hypothetical protein
MHTFTDQEWIIKKQNEARFSALKIRQARPTPAQPHPMQLVKTKPGTQTEAGAKQLVKLLKAAQIEAAAVDLVKTRQETEDEPDPTQLSMHWYNNETKKWTNLPGGYINEGAFTANVPPSVLSNPGFSGFLANMLVTELVYNPKSCSEFETLVNGKCVMKNCSYFAFLDSWDKGCIEDTHCMIGTYVYASHVHAS